ncbi:MAG: hypothetical protein ACP5O2_09625, partial [Bacteroidales bacterium]
MLYLRNFFLLLLLTVYSLHALSQATLWCPPGASWKYDYQGPQNQKGFISIDYTGDSLVQGKNCQVLQRTRFYVTAENSNLQIKTLGKTLTYFEDPVVYVWDDYNEDFDTLFFFSTHAGDRYPVAIAPVFSQTLWMRADVQGRLMLKSMDNENIEAGEVQYDVKLENGQILSRIDTLADGIGIVSGYFFPVSVYLDQIGQNEGGLFRCYSVNGKLIYKRPGAPDCDYINAAEPLVYGEEVSIWPLPVSDFFVLKGIHNKASHQNARLTDLSGRFITTLDIREGQGRI